MPDTSSASSSSSGKRTKATPVRAGRGKVGATDVQANPDQLLPYTLDSKTLVVYVTKTSSNPNTASFTLANQAGTTTGGVALLSKVAGVSVSVNWVLGTGITSLTSEVESNQFIHLSGNTWSISFTTPPTSYALGIPFLVNFTTGEPHDPQMIVTPIGGSQKAPAKPLPAKRGAKVKRKAPAKVKARAKRPAKRRGK